MNEFNTGWDPYEELMQHRHNIEQLVLAINQGSELMKELGHRYNHQQEVIQQLMFQNRKLTTDVTNLRIQVENLKNNQR